MYPLVYTKTLFFIRVLYGPVMKLWIFVSLWRLCFIKNSGGVMLKMRCPQDISSIVEGSAIDKSLYSKRS